MNTTMATDFLTRCFHPTETIAILLRCDEPVRTAQRIVRLEQATAPAYMRWLAHENASGGNVYVAANPLRSGSRKRTKECVAEIRHLYLDIDVDGEARLTSLLASTEVPTPGAIVSTSPSKYQVLWRVEGFDFSAQESMLKRLAMAFGGDPACTDCNRVIRVPGFCNCKYIPAHLVTAQYPSNSIGHSDNFRLAAGPTDAVLSLPGAARHCTDKKRTNSEQDWVWVLSELSSGKDAAEITQGLAARRTDKPNPLYYAQRTVDVASARLALLAGTPIPDVITSLEARHAAELPLAVCSACAREIAHTAAHMIARQKLA